LATVSPTYSGRVTAGFRIIDATKVLAPINLQSETKSTVQTPANAEFCVEVGDTVDYEYLDDGRLASAQIVRGIGDPTSGSINRDSALAKALLDAVSGETIEFLSPKGSVNLKVRAIHRH
jgi:transcription elongation GreA/GreB family factor